MLDRSFSIGKAIKFGWKKFKDQPWTWIFSLLLVFFILGTHAFVVNWALGNDFTWNIDNAAWDYSHLQLDEHTQLKGNAIVWSISLAYLLVKIGFTLGLIRMAIKAADDLPVKIRDLFSRFRYVFHQLFAQIIFGIVLIVGFILFLFPGLIWASKFSLYSYFIADRGIGPIRALELSSQATDGAKWDMFGLIFITLCIFIIGLIPFGIGLFVTLPLIMIAWGVVYRRLGGSIPTEILTVPEANSTLPK